MSSMDDLGRTVRDYGIGVVLLKMGLGRGGGVWVVFGRMGNQATVQDDLLQMSSLVTYRRYLTRWDLVKKSR
jgi:hypothetical protein